MPGNIAFVVGRINNPNMSSECSTLRTLTQHEYSTQYQYKAIAIAQHNGVSVFNPIQGMFSINVIFAFVERYSKGNKTKAEKAFDLVTFAAARDILCLYLDKCKYVVSYGDFYAKKLNEDYVNTISKILNSDLSIINISKYFFIQISRAYIWLKEENFFEEHYMPQAVFFSKRFSMNKITNYLKENYKIRDKFAGKYSIDVQWDQYIQEKVSKKLKKISYEASKNNLVQMLSKYPSIKHMDIYWEVEYVKMLVDDSHNPIEYFKTLTPLSGKIGIGNRIVKFSIFPENSKFGAGYEKLVEYAKSNNMTVPSNEELQQINIDNVCKDAFRNTFNDKEVLYLNCIHVSLLTLFFVPDQIKHCDFILNGEDDVINYHKSYFCEQASFYSGYVNKFMPWFDELLGMCSKYNTHSEL